MNQKIFIEVKKAEEKEATIIDSVTNSSPRVGEIIDITDAENSKGHGEVEVSEVSYKVTSEGLEVWVKAAGKLKTVIL